MGLIDILKLQQALHPHNKLSPTYGWTNDQSHLRVDGRLKLPTGEQKTKVAYGLTIQHKGIPKREGQRPKLPRGVQMTKVAYGWTENQKSPTMDSLK